MLKHNRIVKKIQILILLSCSSVMAAFADGYYVGRGHQGKRLAVYEPDFKNLTSAEQAVITDLESIIRVDLHDYAGFTIVDAQNLSKIKKLQAESEGINYRDDTQLKADMMKFAEYEAFITVSKSGSKYSLGVSVTDLNSGLVVGEHIEKNIARVSDIEEEGVNNLISVLVPKLGVELTALGKYALSGGDTNNLSVDQQASYVEQEVTALQKTLDDFDRQLRAYSSSSTQLDANSIAIKAQLEAERQITEQRLIQARQKAQRLEEQRIKAEKDNLAAAERSAKSTAKITSLSNEVEVVASQIRKGQFNSLTFMEQISIIEKEKKAYLDLKAKINNEIDLLYAAMNADYNESMYDINDVSIYRRAELDSERRPTQEAIEIKKQQNREIYNKLKSETDANVDKLRSSSQIQLDEILKDINEKQKTLSKTQSINSLMTEGLLVVGDYDGNTKSWNADINIVINGVRYIQDEIQISFNDLSKALDGNTYTDAEMRGKGDYRKYEDYLDSVDAYESLFRLGSPIIYLLADYTVVPSDKNHPSTYELKPVQYRLYSTRNKKLISSFKPSKSSFVIKLSPVYDLRTENEITSYERKEEAREQIVVQRESLRRTRDNKKLQARLMRKSDIGAFGGYFTDGVDGGFTSELSLSIGTSRFQHFSGIVNITFPSDETGDDDMIIESLVGYGLNFFIPIGNSPDVYGQVAGGLSMFGEELCFVAEAEAGIEFPISSIYALNVHYTLNYNHLLGVTNKYMIGLTMPLGR